MNGYLEKRVGTMASDSAIYIGSVLSAVELRW